MKIYYINDRKTKATIYIDTMVYTAGILQPAEARAFEVKVGEGQVPYIKVWETNAVLISSVPEDQVFGTPQKR